LSDAWPVRNLPPQSEHWGRVFQARVENIERIRLKASQSLAGTGRFAASSAQDIANAATGIEELASEIENALLVFPRPYVLTKHATGWAVGAGWATVATVNVTVPDDKTDVTISALADFYVQQEGSAPTTDFEWPFDLSFVTSEFGPRPPLPYHRGIDFSYGGISGDDIPAAAGGTVILNNYYEDWGNYIRIGHSDLTGVPGTWTGYAHLQSPSPLSVGSTVTQGQVIGQVGTTGYSTGPHLHFETALENERIDPRQFFDIFGGTSPGAAIAVEGRVVINGVPSLAFAPPQTAGYRQAIRVMGGLTLAGAAGKTYRVDAQVRTGSEPLQPNPNNTATLTAKGIIE
jgi:murein DD-endopeptidase MepM/ murein hydrolase activator NlpD